MITQYPSTPKPRQATVTSVTPTYKSTSHSLKSYVRSRGVQAWAVELDYPPMTRITYSPLWAFQMQQRGQFGDFEFVLPEHEPQGEVDGTPVITPTSNLFTYSESFDSSEWSPSSLLERNGTETSHNNGTAEVWVRSTGSGQWEKTQSDSYGTTLGQVVTFSAYFKNTHNADRCILMLYDSGASAEMAKVNVYWDGTEIDSVTETSGSAYSPEFGYTEIGDGWYRVFGSVTAIGNDCYFSLYPASDLNGDSDGDGVAIFGAQLETDIETPSYYKPTAGTAIVDALPTGRQVGTTGWQRSVDGQLKAGDFIKLAGHRKVYMVTEDCDSDGSGYGTVSIEPALTNSVADGETLVVEDVPFRMRFADDVSKTGIDRNLFYGWSTKLVETL